MPEFEISLRPYAEMFGKQQGLPDGLMTRLIQSESGFNTEVPDSSAGAKGIAQFMPGTAKMFNINPYDPIQSLKASAEYVRQLVDLNNGDYSRAIAQYKGYADLDKGSKARDVQKVVTGFGSDAELGLRLNAEMPSLPVNGEVKVLTASDEGGIFDKFWNWLKSVFVDAGFLITGLLVILFALFALIGRPAIEKAIGTISKP